MGTMKRGASTNSLMGIVGLLTSMAGSACGSGLHDKSSKMEVTRTIAEAGDTLELCEAKIEFAKGCLTQSVPITLKRIPAIDQTGFISPVFEITVPDPFNISNDPKITIDTTQKIYEDDRSKIGILVPTIDQWFPVQPNPPLPCEPMKICGPVQRNTFTNPGGRADWDWTTNVLQLAIITQCGDNADNGCPSGQACNSGACQRCPAGSLCP
jgi:hypothetical protein